MPVAAANWATVDQVVAELETDGHTIVQIVPKDGDQLAVLYRRTFEFETR